MKKSLLVSTLLLASFSAHAVYLCTSPEGKATYQDVPCPTLPTNAANYPIAAKQLTPKIATDTVMRFNESLNQRDQVAALKYFSADFRIVFDAPGRKVALQRNQAQMIFDTVVSANKKYKATPQCTEPKAEGDKFVLECDLKEQWAAASRQGTHNSHQVIRVKLENGYAVLHDVRWVVSYD